MGFYLQIELPNWTFEMGKRPSVDEWLEEEAHRIFREYGNHPSFVMLSLGNELNGDLASMDALVGRLRKLEPQLLFTSTTFSFSPRGKVPGLEDDFFVSQQTECGWVRGQGFLNNTVPNTTSDYREGASCIRVPLVTHEVGQYVVYPDLDELSRYDSSPLRATAWEAIKADLERKGRLNEAAAYTRASGKLAALLYKEDMERALRTKDLAGIHLLQLQDFPGQATATVGVLDAFWDSKGFIEPAEFREFCGPTVPLARMSKMVFQNNEAFSALIELAHFGATPLTNVNVLWQILDGTNSLSRGKFTVPFVPPGNGFKVGEISQALTGVTEASRLTLLVTSFDTSVSNHWNFWVYPESHPVLSAPEISIHERFDDVFLQALRDGKRVLFLPSRGVVRQPIEGRFIPVFWSPLHFPNQPGTLGAMIDVAHPVWRLFPTDAWTDWQWWELLQQSFAVNLDGVSIRPAMPFRFVDKYNRNALPAGIFEARVGAGRLMVCTLDISQKLEHRIVARQLRRSLLDYMTGDLFNPQHPLSEADLERLFRTLTYQVHASSAHPDYPAEAAVDGNTTTFWHTDWHDGEKLPAQFEVDIGREQTLCGFAYTPRQDMDRGRIARYKVEVSLDGKQWQACSEGGFPNDKATQRIEFASPMKGRYMRLTAISDFGELRQAAIAELQPLIEAAAPDVRALGVVPGFNDAK
ncbi:MAG: discoidin domain-containing protein [Verrucomicrobiota bacterium]